MIKEIRFILLFLFSLLFIASVKADDDKKYKLKTVVIDAGHGGKDPGACGKKIQEKKVALAVALKLGKYITKTFPDINVIYTRKTDIFVPLHKRAEIANSNNADLFISIHVNANKSSYVTGTSTYVMGIHKTDENLDLAKRENSVILYEDDYTTKYEGYDPNSPESFIIFSLVVNTYQSQSLALASKIQEQFRERARRKDRGVKQAGLVVLWNTTMPSVLVETGFITNSIEEKYLSSNYGQDIIASAIFRAFRDYKEMVENKSNFKAAELVELENIEVGSDTPKTQEKKDKNEPEIIFKVQLRCSIKPIPLTAKNFNGVKSVEEHLHGKLYKYMVGRETTVANAIKLQNKIRKKYPDAFVVAFKNGEKISFSQAVKELNNHP